MQKLLCITWRPTFEMSCGQLACRRPCLCAFVDWTVHVDGGGFFLRHDYSPGQWREAAWIVESDQIIHKAVVFALEGTLHMNKSLRLYSYI